MSLTLDKTQILDRLKHKKFTISKDELINRITRVRDRSLSFLKLLIKGKLDGYERNIWTSSDKHQTNPMLWEFGHIVFFWEHKTLRLLEDDSEFIDSISLHDSADIYDSFIVNAQDRYKIKLYPVEKVLEVYSRTIDHIIDRLKKNEYKLTPTTCYLLSLSILHNEMHNESYLFTQKMLKLLMQKDILKPDILMDKLYQKSDTKNKMVYIQGGSFRQGVDDDINGFHFDNEMPSFNVEVKDFYISKYPITEGQFLKFVEAGGYDKEEYWCKPGWRWIQDKRISVPLYWTTHRRIKNYFVQRWANNVDKIIPGRPLDRHIQENMPMCHISWYEACAYCRWDNGRLPTESEWEYLAKDYDVTGNLDYNNGDIVPVDYFEKKDDKDNEDNIQQLFGNVWEWCQEPIYPYDGFIIDPVYREMSYPFFGYKKICRGGSWATPSYLVNATYRNAQMPDNRIQFIGFRIVKDN